MQLRAKTFFLIGTILLAVAGLSFWVLPGYAQDDVADNIERGGRLYQAWDLVLDASLPDRGNPIWKEIAPDDEPDPRTWRCVTCHGWDYSGANGWAPRAVVNRAGIPGLFGMVAEEQATIIAWLDGTTNPGHDFSDYLSETDMRDLGAFLSSGLILPELVADRETGLVHGTLATGGEIYLEYCNSCHGTDGAKINFGGAANPLYLADISLQNPWRVAHVIRFGHLNVNMPSAQAVDLGFSQQLDLLAYAQTLPQAKIIGSPEYPVIEYESQAHTDVLAYISISIVLVILGASVWVTKRKP